MLRNQIASLTAGARPPAAHPARRGKVSTFVAPRGMANGTAARPKGSRSGELRVAPGVFDS
jgi:hypothetical protein